MPLLFSYGTLQHDDVQVQTFGRRLRGERDELPGYEPALVPVEGAHITAATGRTHHDNARFTGRSESRVSGTVFEVTEADLQAADRYEHPASYIRVRVTLASEKQAWVYVHAPGTL